jgi:GrpB-like predicted nucleotidyltransferase (UPF0157 family)
MTNEELWALFPITLCAYDGEWPKQYEKEKENLTFALSGAIERIHHIGSTSVSGLLSKPTVDILIEIKESTDLAALKQAMERMGYIHSPQPENPAPHSMFLKGYTQEGFAKEVFHVHIRYLGDWDELIFRDYLRAHGWAREAYAALKRDLAVRFKHNRDGYTEAKGAFIKEIVEKGRQ